MYAQAAYSVTAVEQGRTEGVTVTNSDGEDVSAYAIGQYGSDGHCTNLYVTIINKEFGSSATNVVARIIPTGMTTANPAMHAMWLVQKEGYVTATNDVTLGGASLDGTGPWQRKWVDLGIMQSQYGYWNETVTNLTAVILEFSAPDN